MQAIQTEYNGYKFRSRLEARWAVFFDMLKVRYQYEPQGYVLADGKKYLPDFYLNDFDTYVEIKSDPMMLTDYDKLKINGFADLAKSNDKGYVVLFDVPRPEKKYDDFRQPATAKKTRYLPDIDESSRTIHSDEQFEPFACPNCGQPYTHAHNVRFDVWERPLPLNGEDVIHDVSIYNDVSKICIDYWCESYCTFTHVIHNRKGFQISSYKNRVLWQGLDFWKMLGNNYDVNNALNFARKARFEFGQQPNLAKPTT